MLTNCLQNVCKICKCSTFSNFLVRVNWNIFYKIANVEKCMHWNIYHVLCSFMPSFPEMPFTHFLVLRTLLCMFIKNLKNIWQFLSSHFTAFGLLWEWHIFLLFVLNSLYAIKLTMVYTTESFNGKECTFPIFMTSYFFLLLYFLFSVCIFFSIQKLRAISRSIYFHNRSLHSTNDTMVRIG